MLWEKEACESGLGVLHGDEWTGKLIRLRPSHGPERVPSLRFNDTPIGRPRGKRAQASQPMWTTILVSFAFARTGCLSDTKNERRGRRRRG